MFHIACIIVAPLNSCDADLVLLKAAISMQAMALCTILIGQETFKYYCEVSRVVAYIWLLSHNHIQWEETISSHVCQTNSFRYSIYTSCSHFWKSSL